MSFALEFSAIRPDQSFPYEECVTPPLVKYCTLRAKERPQSAYQGTALTLVGVKCN